ncbi:MAG: hypothetical protein ABI675_19480 [Chitinophagaceae bacterium]
MSVIFKDGIGYSNRTKTAYVVPTGGQADGKKITVPEVKDFGLARPWADWGTTNDLPIKMAKDIEECGVLSAGLDGKARIATGKGPAPFLLVNVDNDGKEELEYVKDPEIQDWFEMNDSFNFSFLSSYDLFSYGWSPTQMMLSRDRTKINRIKRTDVVTARLERKSKISGEIEGLYLNADWQCNYTYPSEYIKRVPVLAEGGELQDLLGRTGAYEFAIINRQLRNGKQYYPPPLWYSTKAWVDIAKAIPAMKMAMFNNQMTIKYVVTISQNYWTRIHKTWASMTSTQRQDIIDNKLDEIDKYLAGNENQYKSIFANSYIDPVTKTETADIKIDVLDDKVKDGKLLPDGSAATSEILFALMINPALFGAGTPEGSYSKNPGGSNIREAYMVQIMMLESERRMNARPLNIVKHYNGWAKRLETAEKRLVFRYPSGLLTTLDTGKSTKPEIV